MSENNATIDNAKEKPIDAVDNRGLSVEASAKPITGENGEKLTGREAESYAVNAVTRTMNAFTQRLEQLAKKGSSLAETIGMLDNARSINDKKNSEDAQKKKEKFEKALRSAMKQALPDTDELIKAIDKEIQANKEKIFKLEKEAEVLKDARERLEAGEDLEEVLKDPEVRSKIDDYKRRTGKDVDLNDRDTVLHILLLEEQFRRQQADEYRKRNEDLTEKKEQIKEKVAEIEASNKPDAQKAEEIQKVLEAATSPEVQEVWRDKGADEELKVLAGKVITENDEAVGLEQKGASLFESFESKKKKKNSGVGEGIRSKEGDIQLKNDFTVAASGPDTSPDMQIAVANKLTLDVLKI